MECANGIFAERRTARIAGLWYLLLAAGSGASWFYMAGIIVEGDAIATTRNILATGTAYLASILGSIVGQIGFILLALTLYRLLRKTSEAQARLMLAFVLVAVPIMFVNIVFQAGAYLLLDRAGFLGAFSEAQQKALAMLLVHLHVVGLHVVDVFWGLWLLPLGLLVYRSGLFPGILAILLLASGGAYVLDSLSYLVAPGVFSVLERYLSIPEAAGEMAMLFWLLIKGVKARRTGGAGPDVPANLNGPCPGTGK